MLTESLQQNKFRNRHLRYDCERNQTLDGFLIGKK